MFNIWGSYGSGKRPGWLDRGGGRNSSLFTCFRACMFVLYVNFRSFGLARVVGRRIFVVILVVFPSSTSSMFIFPANSRTVGVLRSETSFAW